MNRRSVDADVVAVVTAVGAVAAQAQATRGRSRARKPSASRRPLRADDGHVGRRRRMARTKSSRSTARPTRPRRTTRRALLLENARKFYGTSNEELMDNAKQFATFPIAVLQVRRQLLERHDQREVQDGGRRRRTARPASLQRQAERRLAVHPLQRHRAQRRALGVPQRRRAGRARSDREQPVHARSRRVARAEADRRRRGAQGVARRRSSALEYTLGTDARARPQRRARRTRICSRRTTRCCSRR